MNEEEKKAIERIEDTFYSDLGKGINKFQKITLYEDSIKDVRIVLNLLEKLQKENEELKETYKSEKKMKNEYVKLYQDLLLKENVIPIQKVKDKIEELQKEYNKLDKQVDEYIKSVEKDVSTYYENKERISIMQTLSYFIDTLQELIEEREGK